MEPKKNEKVKPKVRQAKLCVRQWHITAPPGYYFATVLGEDGDRVISVTLKEADE